MEPKEKLALANEIIEFLDAKTKEKGTDTFSDRTKLEVLSLVAKAIWYPVTFIKVAEY
jgi:hypothetical protein